MRLCADLQDDSEAAPPIGLGWKAGQYWQVSVMSGGGSSSIELHDEDLSEEELVLRALGIGKPTLAAARLLADRNGTSIEQEILASGVVASKTYYEALARIAGLPFVAEIDPGRVIASEHLDVLLVRPERLTIDVGGKMVQAIVPRAANIAALARRLKTCPVLGTRLVVTAPQAVRDAVWAQRAEARAEEVTRHLFEGSSKDSARLVLTGRQGFVLGLCLAALVAASVFAMALTSVTIHSAASLLFLSCVSLRGAAVVAFRKPARPDLSRACAARLPRYSVVVALRHEDELVEQLVQSLSRLVWPRSLLDIKLVCEADDGATLAAIEKLALPPEFEVVRVPPIGPRTKPKALKYALAGVRSDYLVVYDAEDRPHPEQLLEAWSIFSCSDDRLAVLQAPLVISNAGQSWWASVFALEYAGLFRGLLPLLARSGLPLPLGGTSNHFRVAALRACGAWDPHNVTEDADLGLRLHRQGYRAGVLVLPTQEPAPTQPSVWLKQRTRWFKGWLQTWLVMMRSPIAAWREMGTRGFLVSQILIAGMLVSALAHPLLYVFFFHTVGKAAVGHIFPQTFANRALFGIDMFDIVGGYLIFTILAWRTMAPLERSRGRKHWLWLPIYWLAMFAASWIAVWDLIKRPFYWAKTPHQPIDQPAPAPVHTATRSPRFDWPRWNHEDGPQGEDPLPAAAE